MTKVVPLVQQFLQYIKSAKGFENKIMEKVNVVSVRGGECRAELTVENDHTNFWGILHGGCSASLIDITSALAVFSHKKNCHVVSVNMNLTYLKSASVGDDIEIIAKIIKSGNTLAFLEICLRNKVTSDLLVTGTQVMKLSLSA